MYWQINFSSKSLKFRVLLLLLVNEEREWRLQRWSVGLKYSKMNKLNYKKIGYTFDWIGGKHYIIETVVKNGLSISPPIYSRGGGLSGTRKIETR